MTLKKSELKGIVKEVVRQCIQEAGAAYKVRDGRSYIEQTGKVNRARDMQDDPKVNEDFPTEEPETSQNQGGEDEKSEIRLIKAVGQAIIKLLQMHQGMEEPEGTEGEEFPETQKAPPFPPKKSPEKSEKPAEKEEDELDESNCKVQHRSYKTVQDQDNNPKNVRDPEVPQA